MIKIVGNPKFRDLGHDTYEVKFLGNIHTVFYDPLSGRITTIAPAINNKGNEKMIEDLFKKWKERN